MIYPVPNKWGKQGWTIINLDEVREDMLTDAVRTAYCEVASASLVSILEAKEAEQNAIK